MEAHACGLRVCAILVDLVLRTLSIAIPKRWETKGDRTMPHSVPDARFGDFFRTYEVGFGKQVTVAAGGKFKPSTYVPT